MKRLLVVSATVVVAQLLATITVSSADNGKGLGKVTANSFNGNYVLSGSTLISPDYSACPPGPQPGKVLKDFGGKGAVVNGAWNGHQLRMGTSTSNLGANATVTYAAPMLGAVLTYHLHFGMTDFYSGPGKPSVSVGGSGRGVAHVGCITLTITVGMIGHRTW